eukprot:1158190-Pelagomonas_calceolata.AAC.7
MVHIPVYNEHPLRPCALPCSCRYGCVVKVAAALGCAVVSMVACIGGWAEKARECVLVTTLQACACVHVRACMCVHARCDPASLCVRVHACLLQSCKPVLACACVLVTVLHACVYSCVLARV